MANSVGTYLSYDSEADILELVKDPDHPYVSREVRHGFFIHVDPETGSIVGFAIHHFAEDSGAKPLSLPLKASFEPIEGIDRDLSLAPG